MWHVSLKCNLFEAIGLVPLTIIAFADNQLPFLLPWEPGAIPPGLATGAQLIVITRLVLKYKASSCLAGLKGIFETTDGSAQAISYRIQVCSIQAMHMHLFADIDIYIGIH